MQGVAVADARLVVSLAVAKRGGGRNGREKNADAIHLAEDFLRRRSRSAQAWMNSSTERGARGAAIERYSRSMGLGWDSWPARLVLSRWAITEPKKNHQRSRARSRPLNSNGSTEKPRSLRSFAARSTAERVSAVALPRAELSRIPMRVPKSFSG